VATGIALALLAVALVALALVLARLVARDALRAPVPDDVALEHLVDRIDRVLPQTQCGQCRYAGCRPYAGAIARGEADINQCPPGGAAGIRALAALLGREPKPLDPAHGVEKPRMLALIDEAVCIGCTKCIQACPVDAILGASKRMHTVIASLCTGCELCIPPCPVDCIDLVPASTPSAHATNRAARQAS
jgi:electron transport complex protein RnfB